MSKVNSKELIQIDSLKKRFSKDILIKMADWISKEESEDKRKAIKDISLKETLTASDSLFIIYKIMSLPYYVRTNLATKLRNSIDGI